MSFLSGVQAFGQGMQNVDGLLTSMQNRALSERQSMQGQASHEMNMKINKQNLLQAQTKLKDYNSDRKDAYRAAFMDARQSRVNARMGESKKNFQLALVAQKNGKTDLAKQFMKNIDPQFMGRARSAMNGDYLKAKEITAGMKAGVYGDNSEQAQWLVNYMGQDSARERGEGYSFGGLADAGGGKVAMKLTRPDGTTALATDGATKDANDPVTVKTTDELKQGAENHIKGMDQLISELSPADAGDMDVLRAMLGIEAPKVEYKKLNDNTLFTKGGDIKNIAGSEKLSYGNDGQGNRTVSWRDGATGKITTQVIGEKASKTLVADANGNKGYMDGKSFVTVSSKTKEPIKYDITEDANGNKGYYPKDENGVPTGKFVSISTKDKKPRSLIDDANGNKGYMEGGKFITVSRKNKKPIKYDVTEDANGNKGYYPKDENGKPTGSFVKISTKTTPPPKPPTTAERKYQDEQARGQVRLAEKLLSEGDVQGANKVLNESSAKNKGSEPNQTFNMDTYINQSIKVESNGKANAKNPRSTATGLGQFLDDTWIEQIKKHDPASVKGKTRDEILALRKNGAISKKVMRGFSNDNMKALKRNGHEVNYRNMYLAHHFGNGGTNKLLRASPSQSVKEIFPDTKGKDGKWKMNAVRKANPHVDKAKTVGGLIDWAEGKMYVPNKVIATEANVKQRIGHMKARLGESKGGQTINVDISQGKVEPGFVRIKDESTPSGFRDVPVTGGKEDAKRQAAAAKKELQKKTKQRAGDIVLTNLGQLGSKIKSAPWYDPANGPLSAITEKFRSAQAVDAQSLVNTISANIGFDRLQQMRDESPTGGALGAINRHEMDLLTSVLGSLSLAQSEKQLLQKIDEVTDIYNKIIHGPDYVAKSQAANATPATPEGGQANSVDSLPDDIESGLRALGL